jgi:hypothetical protein
MVGLIVVTIFSKFSSAFEPKLLWKKEIPSEASEISLARKSGDLIFIHGEKHNKITFLDKKGNTQLQLGPDLERTFAGTSLSDDGRYFTYSSYYQMLVEYRKGPLNYIHYLEKNGKELWRKELLGHTIISPDGKTIFAGWPEMESGYSYFLDSSGKILRKIGPVGEIDGNLFSPDSNYFLLSEPYDFLYSRDGTLVWKKDLGYITSISDNTDYIGFEKYKEGTEGGLFSKGEDVGGIYDRKANLIYKGRARVSGNGKIAITHYENRIELLKLPEKIVFNQFPIRRLDYPYMQYSPEAFNSRISYNGKYIAILGKRVDRNTLDNLYIIDVENASLWEYKLEEIQRSDGLLIELTDEGKYLLFVHTKGEIGKSFIYYFELY